ncbi:MAG: transposase, partial [Akkermansia muciniphila]|nr:transposase [Akkermansia muciniphila]
TSNIMECVNSQLKKRTRLIPVFPSEASLLRLLTARLMDLSDEWEGNCGRAYISPEKLEIIAEVLNSAKPEHRCITHKNTGLAERIFLMAEIFQKKGLHHQIKPGRIFIPRCVRKSEYTIFRMLCQLPSC